MAQLWVFAGRPPKGIPRLCPHSLPFRIRSLSPGAAVGEGVVVIARMPLLGSACQHLEG